MKYERITIDKIVTTSFGGGSTSGYIENTWIVIGTIHADNESRDFIATVFEHIPESVMCDKHYEPEPWVGNIRNINSSGKFCQFEIGDEIETGEYGFITDEDIKFIEDAVVAYKNKRTRYLKCKIHGRIAILLHDVNVSDFLYIGQVTDWGEIMCPLCNKEFGNKPAPLEIMEE